MKKLAAVTVILGAIQLADGQSCPPGTYRDHVTSRCDSCSDICKYKEITDTVDDCHKYCPDYGKAYITSSTSVPDVTCGGDQVYSVTLSTCLTCDAVCDQPRDKRSISQCAKDCSEVTPRSSEHTIIVAVTVLCAIIIIVAALGLTWIFCWKKRRLLCIQEPPAPPPVAPPTPPPSLQLVPPHPVPHPSIRYVPVPIHVQCEDNETSSSGTSEGYDEVPTEETAKFPSAFPDLPYTAQLSPDST